MSESFNKALNFTLSYEGGYVNDPDDRGGETNMGITSSTLTRAKREGLVSSVATVKSLTKDQASTIYKAYYWDLYDLDDVSYAIDCIVFDMTVNHGSSGAMKITQRALNAVGYSNVSVDGIFGPITKAAMIDGSNNKNASLATALLSKRKDYYDSIVKNNSSQKKYLNGWYNRIKKLASDTGTNISSISF